MALALLKVLVSNYVLGVVFTSEVQEPSSVPKFTVSARVHPLASDMPTSPDDTGIVPADVMATMAATESELDKSANSAVTRSKWTCAGQRRRVFNNHMHVYRMMFDSEPHGVKDRDAGSLWGILELMTGGDPSLPNTQRVSTAWGLNRYYHKNGIMEVVYVSYTKMGTYQSCNAANPGQPGSPHVCSDCTKPSSECCCSSPNTTRAKWLGAVLPGQLKAAYTGGEWYSFNGQGEGQTWHQFECPSVRVEMTTLVDELAKAGKCGKCSDDTSKCAECIRTKVPREIKEKIFHELFHITSFGAQASTVDGSIAV